MKIHEIMTPHVRVLTPSHLAKDAYVLMEEENIRHIPIVENGELVGIVSHRDVRPFLVELGMSEAEQSEAGAFGNRELHEIMQTKPIIIDPDADLVDAINLLIENKIGALPVIETDNGLLRGIVSYEDILRVARDILADDEEFELPVQ